MDALDWFMAGIIGVGTAVIVALVVWLFVGSSDESSRQGNAERSITQLCSQHGGAVYFDVENQDNLVYACNDDGKLHLRAY